MGRPIVAGYNWILTPASIFVGHQLKTFYSTFENILNDSLSLVKLLELVLNSAVMEFQKKNYRQILGIVMGTNLAPILANIYMAMLEEELIIK